LFYDIDSEYDAIHLMLYSELIQFMFYSLLESETYGFAIVS